MDQPSSQVTLQNAILYMVENVWNKKEDRQGDIDQQHHELTVKECLGFSVKKGLPRRQHWAHLGCTFKAPPFACQIPHVPMKGQVIEATNWDEAVDATTSPEFDRVGGGIYSGPSGNGTRYVGLRDVIIIAVEKIEGLTVATVQIFNKKKTSFVKVSVECMFLELNVDDPAQVTEPTGLLVDFCFPRLSIN